MGRRMRTVVAVYITNEESTNHRYIRNGESSDEGDPD